MAIRRGLGKGKGKGYKNIIPKDHPVHVDSGHGRKQPQFKNMYVDIQWWGYEKAKSILNSDGSSKFPIKRDAIGRALLFKKEKGFYKLKDRFPKDVDADGVPDHKDCDPNDPTKQDFPNKVADAFYDEDYELLEKLTGIKANNQYDFERKWMKKKQSKKAKITDAEIKSIEEGERRLSESVMVRPRAFED